jgi:dihydroorotate dehydrogenase (fumarate)
MVVPISKITLSIYKFIIKPILFLFPADFVHASVTKLGIFTLYIPFSAKILRWFYRYDNPALKQNIADINFENPIGLSAGFDKEIRLPKLMQAVGFGLAEVGSITARNYEGNKKPWYSRLPHTQSILVNSGLRSTGVDHIADLADKKVDSDFSKKFPINVSVAKTNDDHFESLQDSIDDYCYTLKRLEKSHWPSLYTINISCPNTKAGEPFNKPENLKKLLKQIDGLGLSRPVFLKLPIDLGWEKTDALIEVASKSNVTGLTIGNLSKDRTLVDSRDKLESSQAGNLSGKPCWDASNELIARTKHKYRDRFKIIGVGGVFTAEDAYQKIRLGSDLVELLTGMIFRGPAAIGDINKGILERLRSDGLETISQVVGIDTVKYVRELDNEKNK